MEDCLSMWNPDKTKMDAADIIKASKMITRQVYLVTDEYQIRRIITHIVVSKNEIKYVLACSTEISEHYEYEISEQKAL
jgi:endonuclease III